VNDGGGDGRPSHGYVGGGGYGQQSEAINREPGLHNRDQGVYNQQVGYSRKEERRAIEAQALNEMMLGKGDNGYHREGQEMPSRSEMVRGGEMVRGEEIGKASEDKRLYVTGANNTAEGNQNRVVSNTEKQRRSGGGEEEWLNARQGGTLLDQKENMRNTMGDPTTTTTSGKLPEAGPNDAKARIATLEAELESVERQRPPGNEREELEALRAHVRLLESGRPGSRGPSYERAPSEEWRGGRAPSEEFLILGGDTTSEAPFSSSSSHHPFRVPASAGHNQPTSPLGIVKSLFKDNLARDRRLTDFQLKFG